MKLLYLSLLDFPRRVANRVQIMNMASAFARQCATSLTVSKLHMSTGAVQRYYGIDPRLKLEVLGESRFRPRSFFSIGRLLSVLWREKPTVVFVREENLAWILSWLGVPYIYEIHDFRRNVSTKYPRIFAKSMFVIAISVGLKRACQDAGFDPRKIVVVRDAVDTHNFSLQEPVRLNEGSETVKVMYTGRFSVWKGVYTLLDSVRYLPSRVHVYLIGGFEGEREQLETYIRANGLSDQIHILEHQPYAKVAGYMRAADVLVVPNSGKTEISRNFTSPLKLYEYMAAGKPVVVSDLPSMREIVTDELVTFFTPDDPQSLAGAIIEVINSPELSERKAGAACEFVQNCTWDARAASILQLVDDRTRNTKGDSSLASAKSYDA